MQTVQTERKHTEHAAAQHPKVDVETGDADPADRTTDSTCSDGEAPDDAASLPGDRAVSN